MPWAVVLGVVIIVGALALVIGALVGQALRNRKDKARTGAASADAERIIFEAQTKERELLLEAKEEYSRTAAPASPPA